MVDVVAESAWLRPLDSGSEVVGLAVVVVALFVELSSAFSVVVLVSCISCASRYERCLSRGQERKIACDMWRVDAHAATFA